MTLASFSNTSSLDSNKSLLIVLLSKNWKNGMDLRSSFTGGIFQSGTKSPKPLTERSIFFLKNVYSFSSICPVFTFSLKKPY